MVVLWPGEFPYHAPTGRLLNRNKLSGRFIFLSYVFFP